MKKALSLLMAILLILPLLSAQAIALPSKEEIEVYKISQYTDDELRKMIDISRQQLLLNNLQEGEKIVYDDDIITVIYAGYENEPPDDFSQLLIHFKYINKSDFQINVEPDEESINSYMVYSGSGVDVSRNKIRVWSLSYYHKMLSDINYYNIENIELRYVIECKDKDGKVVLEYMTDFVNIDL